MEVRPGLDGVAFPKEAVGEGVDYWRALRATETSAHAIFLYTIQQVSRCMAGKDVPCAALFVLVLVQVSGLVRTTAWAYIKSLAPCKFDLHHRFPSQTRLPFSRCGVSTKPRARTSSGPTPSSMASSSSPSSSSPTFTWLADYEITLQRSSSSSSSSSPSSSWPSPINITMPAFTSSGKFDITTLIASMTSPTTPLPRRVDLAATPVLSPLSGHLWSSPPPLHTPLAQLWIIWRRFPDKTSSSTSSNGSISNNKDKKKESNTHTLAGLAGMMASAPEEQQSRPFLLADVALREAQDICELLVQGLSFASLQGATPSINAGDIEHVAWVDNHGHDLLSPNSKGLPRPLVHRWNMLHKGAGILVRDEQGRVFVHQRAAHKRIFPSMYDMFVGGVSLFGEHTKATAQRELKEELGFGREEEGNGQGEEKEKKEKEKAFRFLFDVLIETSYNRCFVDVYEYVVQGGREEAGLQLDPEEVQWGEWVTMEEVKRRVAVDGKEGEWTFVPDGLLVWQALTEALGGEERVI